MRKKKDIDTNEFMRKLDRSGIGIVEPYDVSEETIKELEQMLEDYKKKHGLDQQK